MVVSGGEVGGGLRYNIWTATLAKTAKAIESSVLRVTV